MMWGECWGECGALGVLLVVQMTMRWCSSSKPRPLMTRAQSGGGHDEAAAAAAATREQRAAAAACIEWIAAAWHNTLAATAVQCWHTVQARWQLARARPLSRARAETESTDSVRAAARLSASCHLQRRYL